MDIQDVKAHVIQEVDTLCESILDSEDLLPDDWDALADALAAMASCIAHQTCRISGWAGYARATANREKEKKDSVWTS